MANREGELVAQPQPPPPPGCCPWLVYYHGEGLKNQTFCWDVVGAGPSEVKTYTRSIPVLGGDKKVVCCAHGRLVLYDFNAKSLCLCSSATFEDVQILPELHHLSNHKMDSCVLLPPGGTDNWWWHDFTVVIFLEKLTSIVFCRVGETKWREIKYEKYMEAFFWVGFIGYTREVGKPLLFRRAVAAGSKTYAHLGAECFDGFYRSIFSIEIVVEEEEEEEFGLVLRRVNNPPVDMKSDWSAAYMQNAYMVESCAGELFFLYFSSGAQVFEVYRMNSESMEWERTKSIKDTAFLIGESYCLSCPAPGVGGLIYFSRTKDCRLYCYDMEDGSVLMSLPPHPNLPTPCLSPPIWIMPHLSPIKQKNEHNKGDCNTNNQRYIIAISKLGLNEDVAVYGRQLFDLPNDLLEHVSKHLIATDYMNFRATSKICKSLCPPINWRIALSGHGKSHCFTYPLLMFPDKHDSVYKFMDPGITGGGGGSSSNYYLMRIPDSLQSHTIRYSDQGWVLLSKRDSCVGLYNPFKGDVTSYNYRLIGREECLFFQGKPWPPGSIRVRFSFHDGTTTSVSIQFNDPRKKFTYIFPKSEKSFEVATYTTPVFVKDLFCYYCLDKTGKLGIIKLGPDAKDWEVLEKPQSPADLKSPPDQTFLLNCGEELISVFLGDAGKWVSVYKLNNDFQVWEKVSNLKGYNFYLNQTSSFAMPSSSGGNRLYFPVLRGSSDIVYFSMETGKWHFSGSPQEDSSTDLYGTRWYPNSCWIMPCW